MVDLNWLPFSFVHDGVFETEDERSPFEIWLLLSRRRSPSCPLPSQPLPPPELNPRPPSSTPSTSTHSPHHLPLPSLFRNPLSLPLSLSANPLSKASSHRRPSRLVSSMAAIDFDDLVATMKGSGIGQEAMDLRALHVSNTFIYPFALIDLEGREEERVQGGKGERKGRTREHERFLPCLSLSPGGSARLSPPSLLS